ncbi:hypothetical protein [Micrococcus sp.]|uniref:hypothetical protein n=1 Tax=Micrococcus sp. TaxID=1271 RepID=UPI002A912561|nr:hypothetical protein [Micrococcus sp.]MDY6055341.1 hypothetical protein [Micrococcus sp.]
MPDDPSARPDPLAPLPQPLSGRVRGRGRRPGRRRDVRGRGLRSPLPFGPRADRGRTAQLVAAVEKAVDRLAGLDSPALRHVTARVERVPDRLEQRLALFEAGAGHDDEELFARAERDGAHGVRLTLYERPLREAAEPADLEEAIYAVALSRVAEALAVSPHTLDPTWGRA